MPEPKFLFDLLSTASPSGWESPGQDCWRGHVGGIADSVDSDAYGNTWATFDGARADAPRILLAAHADEIGFIVKHIDDKGFLSMAPIGGSDRTIAQARRIRIFGSQGEVIGVIGNTAIHLRKNDQDKIPNWQDLFVDIGAASSAAVAELGIRVGCPAIYVDEAIPLPGGRVVGRAIDNRVSGYLIARVLEELANGDRPGVTTIALNTVQEEIGSNGAEMAAHRLHPDQALVFDVTHATDTPGIDSKKHGQVDLGKGPTVAHGAANHPQIVGKLIEIAEREQIPIQHEAISRTTSTDTDAIFTVKGGIPSALVSIPMRYMHSPSELIDLADVENAIRLVVAFVRES